MALKSQVLLAIGLVPPHRATVWGPVRHVFIHRSNRHSTRCGKAGILHPGLLAVGLEIANAHPHSVLALWAAGNGRVRHTIQDLKQCAQVPLGAGLLAPSRLVERPDAVANPCAIGPRRNGSILKRPAGRAVARRSRGTSKEQKEHTQSLSQGRTRGAPAKLKRLLMPSRRDHSTTKTYRKFSA